MRLLREVVYTLKNCFRDKSFVFWNIFYPIILCTFFYLAFYSLLGEKTVEFPIGMAQDNELKNFMKEVDVFRILEMEEQEAEQALRDKKIIAYVKPDMDIIVAQSGMGQTTTQTVLKLFKQIFYLFENGGNPANVNFKAEFLKEEGQSQSAFTVIFYTLLAMVSFYSVFGGVFVMESFQANTSEIAKRMTISPIKKGRYITLNALVVLGLNMFSNTLLIFFINEVLKIKLFNDFASSYILVLCGNIWGVFLGIMIGSIGKFSNGFRTVLAIAIPLLLSSMAGMMSPDIKTIIMLNAPILDRFNPASIITGGLYRVNLLGNQHQFWSGVFILLGMSLIFFLISVRSLRRKSYDTF